MLFSGDVTNAPEPDGATELMYFRKGIQNAGLLCVNYFNYSESVPVPCRLLVAQEEAHDFSYHRNYMVDPNNIKASAEVNIKKKQNVIGLVASVLGDNRVYFTDFGMGHSVTSRSGERTTKTRNFLYTKLIHSISLTEILQASGAEVIHKRPEEGDYLDLSPEALDKTTILDLFKS
jgi:hypothetical protein